MKTAKSVGGETRAYFSIQTSINAEEMAVHFLDYFIGYAMIGDPDRYPDIYKLARETGERKIMDAVKNSILFNGDEKPHYSVGDATPAGYDPCSRVADIFRERFNIS